MATKTRATQSTEPVSNGWWAVAQHPQPLLEGWSLPAGGPLIRDLCGETQAEFTFPRASSSRVYCARRNCVREEAPATTRLSWDPPADFRDAVRPVVLWPERVADAETLSERARVHRFRWCPEHAPFRPPAWDQEPSAQRTTLPPSAMSRFHSPTQGCPSHSRFPEHPASASAARTAVTIFLAFIATSHIDGIRRTRIASRVTAPPGSEVSLRLCTPAGSRNLFL
jgi:hypothetical protein